MYSERYRAAGDPSMVDWVSHSAIQDVPELLWYSTPIDAVERIQQTAQELDRWECIATNGTEVTGFIAGASDYDLHVGPCFSIVWHYVLPAYRGYVGQQLLRRAMRVAKAQGHKVLCYTHRTALGVYEVRYIRLRI